MGKQENSGESFNYFEGFGVTRYVVSNDLNNLITETSYYVDPDGNQYPPDFPKNGLLGVSPIADPGQPEYDPALQEVSSTIETHDGAYTNVYSIRDFTEGELASKLDAIRSQKWEDIKNERDNRMLNGGYKVGEKWFHSDPNSRTQQLGLVMLGYQLPSGLQWKTMDGSFVDMTPMLAQQILGAAAASDFAVFLIGEAHKAAVYASADPTSCDITTGWPEGFLGIQPTN